MGNSHLHAGFLLLSLLLCKMQVGSPRLHLLIHKKRIAEPRAPRAPKMKHLGFYNFSVKRGKCQKPRASQVALVVKNPPAKARDTGSTPGSGRSPGGGKTNPLQYCWLENSNKQSSLAGPLCPRVTEKQTRLKRPSTQRRGDKQPSRAGPDL